MRKPWMLMSAIVASATSAAAADRPAPLEPASKWQMDYAPSECRLVRVFGGAADRTVLQIARLGILDVVELGVAGSRIPVTETYLPVSVGTSSTAEVPGMRAQGFAAEGGAPGTLRFRPDKDLPIALRSDAAAQQPTMLTIAFTKRYTVRLALGQMKGALAALDTCTDDLMKTWGLNPAEQRARIAGPEPLAPPGTWFRPNDFPSALNRSGIGGAVIIRLNIDASGAVTDCAISKAGGDKDFEDLTCRLAKARARFRPALGADGKPIATVWIQRIDWRPGQQMVFYR